MSSVITRVLDIALTTIPFFALVLCGWIAARTRRLPADSVAPLNGFVLWFALPATLLRFVAQTPVDTLSAGLKAVARNPLIIAIASGLALSLLHVKIPGPIDEFLRLLASSAGPVALFAIGVFVYRSGPVRADVASWWLIAVKLLVHPLLMWLVGAWVLQLDRDTLAVVTVTTALSAAGTAFLFVERHGGNVDRAASAVLLSTVLSFVTITGLTAWLRATGG